MNLYNFKRLIKKYSVEFCLHRKQGGYVAGKWEQGSEEVKTMRGAIVPLRDSKVYGTGGTYTSKDRELYILEPLRAPLSEYTIVYKGNSYSVEQGRNFEEYADVSVYTLKWVSTHDRPESE